MLVEVQEEEYSSSLANFMKFATQNSLTRRWLYVKFHPIQQRWSRGHKARGQGQGHKKNPRPRPRTAFPRTDTLEAKDRSARGQGQGPRTQAQVLFKKKKKVFTKIFQAISKKKKDLHKNFSSDLHKKTFSKKFFKRSTKF